MSKEEIISNHQIDQELDGKRLDQAVSQLLPAHSRARIQTWIKTGEILLNGKPSKQKELVKFGDKIHIQATLKSNTEVKAEDIPINIVFEDNDIIVINKPAGLVVHPGAGNPNMTLQNALLNHDKKLSLLPRSGIIHRLDKETSGLLLIARNLEVHTFLVDKLQNRDIKREYLALVCGNITAGGTINTFMGRHPARRTRMAVTRSGKQAITHYRIEKRFAHYTLMKVILETGRTHQIRVHFAHIKHPIVGDPEYGRHQSIIKDITSKTREAVSQFPRQALHARQLTFPHPATNESVSFQAEVPDDIQVLLTILEQYDV